MKNFTRIIVMSDSHGKKRYVDEVLQRHPEADAVFHLGDGCDDLDYAKVEYPNIKFYQVAGNCDRFSEYNLREHVIIDGKRFILVHGHEFGVKYSRDDLENYGQSQNADVVLYGHTHRAEIKRVGDMYLMNPGALKDGKYGIIDIVNDKLILNNTEL